MRFLGGSKRKTDSERGDSRVSTGRKLLRNPYSVRYDPRGCSFIFYSVAITPDSKSPAVMCDSARLQPCRRFLRSLLKKSRGHRTFSHTRRANSGPLVAQENVNVGGSLHRTLNRLFVDVGCGNGSRRVRAVIQIDSSIHLVKGALPRYESVIYNWLPECVRTCQCLFQHHRYPLLSFFFHLRTTRITTNFVPNRWTAFVLPPSVFIVFRNCWLITWYVWEIVSNGLIISGRICFSCFILTFLSV